MGVCETCKINVAEGSMVSHLEDFHVGFLPLDEILLLCHQCPYRVPKAKLELMVNHCEEMGHPINRVALDWRNFQQMENQRIADMLRFGTRIARNNADAEVRIPSSRLQKRESTGSTISKRARPISGRCSMFSVKAVPSADGVMATPRRHSEEPNRSLQSEVDEERTDRDPPAEGGSEATRQEEVAGSINPVAVQSDEEGFICSATNFGLEPGQVQQRSEARPLFQAPTGRESPFSDPSDMQDVKNVPKLPMLSMSTRKAGQEHPCAVCNVYIKGIGGGMTAAVRHAVVHDPSVKPYRCKLCDYRGQRRKATINHAERIHGDINAWDCILNDELRDRVYQMLCKCYPEIDWTGRVPETGRIPGF